MWLPLTKRGTLDPPSGVDAGKVSDDKISNSDGGIQWQNLLLESPVVQLM